MQQHENLHIVKSRNLSLITAARHYSNLAMLLSHHKKNPQSGILFVSLQSKTALFRPNNPQRIYLLLQLNMNQPIAGRGNGME